MNVQATLAPKMFGVLTKWMGTSVYVLSQRMDSTVKPVSSFNTMLVCKYDFIVLLLFCLLSNPDKSSYNYQMLPLVQWVVFVRHGYFPLDVLFVPIISP